MGSTRHRFLGSVLLVGVGCGLLGPQAQAHWQVTKFGRPVSPEEAQKDLAECQQQALQQAGRPPRPTLHNRGLDGAGAQGIDPPQEEHVRELWDACLAARGYRIE